MDLPKVAAVLVSPMVNGYCSLRAEVIGDGKQFAGLTFTDHQLNQFRRLLPDDAAGGCPACDPGFAAPT